MKPSAFEMARPTDIDEALALLHEHAGEARPIAGGQSLVPMMNLRISAPALLVDLGRIAGLAGIRLDGEWLRIGAMTRQRELLAYPALAEHAPLLAKAMPHIGHVQTRSRGTIGGSLAHADPSAELAVSMVALDAVFTVRSVAGTRLVPARDFFQDVFTTDLGESELLVEVALRRAPPGTRAAFREFARRHGDFALASAAAQWSPGAGPAGLGIALGGVGVVPHFCAALCEAWQAGLPAERIERLVGDELAALDPLSDLQADAAYRRTLARIALTDCLQELSS